MSKILKRTLSIALVICMMLSVIPMASADPAEPTVHKLDFTGSTIYKWAERETNPNPKSNGYYFLGGTSNTINASSGGIYAMNAYGTWGHTKWAAVVVEVPAGTYDIAARYKSAKTAPDIQIAFAPYSEDLLTEIAGWTDSVADNIDNPNKVSVENKVYFNATYGYDANPGGATGTGYESASYIGTKTFTGGTYVMFLSSPNCNGGNARTPLQSLVLAEAGNGSALIKAVDVISAGMFNLFTDWDNAGDVVLHRAPGSDRIPGNSDDIPMHLYLRGNSITCDSLTCEYGASVVDNTEGAGKVIVGREDIVLSDNTNDKYLPLYDGTAYHFVKPSVVMADELLDPVDSKNDKAVVFNVTLPNAAAYSYVGEDVEITLTVKVGNNDAVVYHYANNGDAENANQIELWADNAGAGDKVFYADLVGLDAVAGETVTFTARITSATISFADTLTVEIPA